MRVEEIQPRELAGTIARVFSLAAEKTMRLDRRWKVEEGAPVFTTAGLYMARGWTQWTQGFQFGNALLCFDFLNDPALLEIGLRHTRDDMTEHLTHMGVHDHGFNTMSTYGQLRRLLVEDRIAADKVQLQFVELAIKASGAVQAARWTRLSDGGGFIYSFNGPHSLFIDTIRTLRVCSAAHALGHTLVGEQDAVVNLLERVCTHARTTARYNIYFGEGRDAYDTPETTGRTSHEALFNVTNGIFRAPSTQQGFSPFTTWTRGLAWAMLGYAEELEFLASLPESEFGRRGIPAKEEVLTLMLRAATATCDFYIEQGTSSDGICYWDTGAPQLHRLGEWKLRPAEPFNAFEPVDASASAIGAQGLLRLGRYLGDRGRNYFNAGLTVARTLFQDPYLSTASAHEGILLHSVYHRPNGWDYIPPGQKVPCGESSMWGDYHMLELALLVHRLASGGYYSFFEREA
jgi:unsaturated chondroitin disaccharide hydrolase